MSPSASASATGGSTITPSSSAQVFWTAKSGMGYVLYHEYINIDSGTDPALAALRYVMATGAKPKDSDYLNFWGDGTTVNSIEFSGELATVDLTPGTVVLKTKTKQPALDQLLWAVAGNHSGIKQVLFKSGGALLPTLGGVIDTRTSLEVTPDVEAFAPIWIEYPVGKVASPVVATGTACTFKAAFAWELTKAGKSVAKGSGLADQACPTRSKWRIELGNLDAGKYKLRVIDYSAEDGSINQQDSKVFTVS